LSTAVQISERVIDAFREAARVLRPPAKVTVAAWAERERILSSETSAEVGRYRITRAPYQRGMQNAVHIPGVQEITYFTSAQIGKSICLENIFGYFAAEDPCPIIFMWPSDKVAKEWSIDSLAPILRDTPALAEIFEVGSRKGTTGKTFKKFPGGWLAILGANAAAGLRRRRARVIFCEEIDAYGASAGSEGNPILLVWKRATTFWNRLLIKASTCTEKGASAIEASYEDSNKQKYWVPCPHCTEFAGQADGFQVLSWKRLVFPKDKDLDDDNVVYPCQHCAVELKESDKQWMLANGEWRAQHPERTKHQGFWINEMYSPFVKWSEMVTQFQRAIAHREDPELLKTFINLSLAETWEADGIKLEPTELLERCEEYPPPALPDGITVLTCGVDVQADRIELEVVGWGKGEESWSVDRQFFQGDTSKIDGRVAGDGMKFDSPWEQLEKFIRDTRYLHARAVRLPIAATFIDSGHHAQVVYDFTKRMQQAGLGCFAAKGFAGFGRPPLSKPTRQSRNKVKLYPLGVDVLKETIYARLKIKEPGAGYLHFSKFKNDADFFAQLTSEKLERVYRHGYPMKQWVLPAGKRNEALDCRVYATAAFLSLSATPAKMLEGLRKQLLDRAKYAAAERRSKTPAGQLELLDVQQTDPAAIAEQAPPPKEDYGEQEYKLVEQEEVAAQAEGKPASSPPEPAQRPAVKIRRGSWI
jgi:phage terminase large subunit GpA-like protein